MPKTLSSLNLEHRNTDDICGGSDLDEPPGASLPSSPLRPVTVNQLHFSH